MAEQPAPKNRVCLVVIDGLGVEGDPLLGDAALEAHTPVLDALAARAAEKGVGALVASGEAVGLEPGLMGNSEVGHLTMGAGRVIPQGISRINVQIHKKEGGLGALPELNITSVTVHPTK